MLDFREFEPTPQQLEKIKAAFLDGWRQFKDVPDTRDTEHRYQLTLQHPEMRQRFLDGCMKNDFWVNTSGATVVIDREFRALNILSQLHRNGDLP